MRRPRPESVRKRRTELGVSQERLAGVAGIALRTLKYLEQGAYWPQRSTWRAVLGALDKLQSMTPQQRRQRA